MPYRPKPHRPRSVQAPARLERGTFAVIYEASTEDDWTDPTVSKRANPNLALSVSLEYLERECRKAQETPSHENTFKRLHLNIRTQQDVRWLSLETWDACDATPIDEAALAGRLCFAGLDLSTTTDLSALLLGSRMGTARAA